MVIDASGGQGAIFSAAQAYERFMGRWSRGLVIGVTTILAADLVSEGRLEVHQTDPVEIELDVLSRMIDAVRAL